jgi:hypothetical protein
MFELLVRNRFGGAALAASGVATGLLVLLFSNVFIPPLGWYIALTGLGILVTSSGLFVIAIIIAIVHSAVQPYRPQ